MRLKGLYGVCHRAFEDLEVYEKKYIPTLEGILKRKEVNVTSSFEEFIDFYINSKNKKLKKYMDNLY